MLLIANIAKIAKIANIKVSRYSTARPITHSRMAQMAAAPGFASSW
jgi:hypothetical protein